MVSLFRVWQVVLSVCCCVIRTRGGQILAVDSETNIYPRLLPDTTAFSTYERGEIQAFESILLNMFGLTERPRLGEKKPVPGYIMDIYNKHSSTRGYSTVDFNIEGKSTGTANTIRSYHHIEDIYDVDSSHRHRLLFNLSIGEGEKLTAAELRIYRQEIPDHKLRKRHAMNISEHITNDKARHRINLYQILKPVTRSRDIIKRLIDSIDIDVRNTTWESLDVSPAVNSWTNDPNSNHGVEIEVIDTGGRPSLHGHDHVRIRRTAEDDSLPDIHDENQWFQQRPLLVTYTDDGRSKRSVKKKRTKRQKKKRRLKPICGRRDLWVNFQEVGWNDWIVAPHGYNAYYCQGECRYPMPDHVNSTNHAIIQTIVHSKDHAQVPEPCCVPTEFDSTTLLYYNNNDELLLKKYRDMVVTACGCR